MPNRNIFKSLKNLPAISEIILIFFFSLIISFGVKGQAVQVNRDEKSVPHAIQNTSNEFIDGPTWIFTGSRNNSYTVHSLNSKFVPGKLNWTCPLGWAFIINSDSSVTLHAPASIGRGEIAVNFQNNRGETISLTMIVLAINWILIVLGFVILTGLPFSRFVEMILNKLRPKANIKSFRFQINRSAVIHLVARIVGGFVMVILFQQGFFIHSLIVLGLVTVAGAVIGDYLAGEIIIKEKNT